MSFYFLAVFIIGANREEALHKIFKGGLHFTDHKTHVMTVTKVNCVRSFLRYLVHGGRDVNGKTAGSGLAYLTQKQKHKKHKTTKPQTST